MKNTRGVGNGRRKGEIWMLSSHHSSNPQSLIPPSSPVSRVSSLLVGIFWVAILAGCSGRLPGRVSGTVTLDDAPLHTGTVVFHPVKGGAAAYGAIDERGNYSVRTGTEQGLVPGQYVVTVVATTGPPPGSKNMMDVGTLLTPTRYGDPKQSDLHFAIEPGVNHIDISLRSRKQGSVAGAGPAR